MLARGRPCLTWAGQVRSIELQSRGLNFNTPGSKIQGGVCSLNRVYFAAGTVYMEQNTTTSCEIDPVLVLLCVHGRN